LIAGGQKCFTKYERVCRYQNQPVCRTQVQRPCVNHPIKYCRTVTTPQYFVSNSLVKNGTVSWDV
jgi:hypothetical protein